MRCEILVNTNNSNLFAGKLDINRVSLLELCEYVTENEAISIIYFLVSYAVADLLFDTSAEKQIGYHQKGRYTKYHI